MPTDAPSGSYLTLNDKKLLKFQCRIDGLQTRAESGNKLVSNNFQYDANAGLLMGLCCINISPSNQNIFSLLNILPSNFTEW